MSKSVNRSWLVNAAYFESSAESVLNRTFVNRIGSFLKFDVRFTFRREKPERVAMCSPIKAKEFKSRLRQGNITIFAALAEADVNHHP